LGALVAKLVQQLGLKFSLNFSKGLAQVFVAYGVPGPKVSLSYFCGILLAIQIGLGYFKGRGDHILS
jgi:hypothetical protein